MHYCVHITLTSGVQSSRSQTIIRHAGSDFLSNAPFLDLVSARICFLPTAHALVGGVLRVFLAANSREIQSAVMARSRLLLLSGRIWLLWLILTSPLCFSTHNSHGGVYSTDYFTRLLHRQSFRGMHHTHQTGAILSNVQWYFF